MNWVLTKNGIGYRIHFILLSLEVCHVIEFEMGKSTSDRSIIVYYDVKYIQNRQSDLAYSVTIETIGNIYGNNLGGAPAFIWTILLRRYEHFI